MKTRNLALLLMWPLLGLTTTAWPDGDVPATEKFARYQPMLKRSPFAIATAAAPLASTPDFAKDLYIANAAHSADGDFVTLASTTDKNLKEYLSTRETVDGYSISNIQWSTRVGETKVTITKDGQFATLTFNEALLSQTIQNPGAQIPPPQPQGIPSRPNPNIPNPNIPNPNIPNPNIPNPNVPNRALRPMPVPQIPNQPQPHTRPLIRRKAGTQETALQSLRQPIPVDDPELNDP